MIAVPPRAVYRRRRAVPGALHLVLQRGAADPPLYRQIQDGIRSAVVSGVLAGGTRLPPERSLAASLDVNRTTVMRAYQELAADGLVTATPGLGTIVAAREDALAARRALSDREPASWLLSLPNFSNGSLGPDPTILRDTAEISARLGLISFAAGAPGQELMPAEALERELRAALEVSGGCLLGYGPVQGLASLRDSLATHMARRGVHADPSEIMVISGATQGLALAARALTEPGDEVVVEAPTYVGILQTFAAAGARLIPVSTDRAGIRMDELASILTRRPVRLIVVQPTLSNPTNATMPVERRERLLLLARRHGVPILEDDAYGELWRDDTGPPPLKALDTHGHVIYVTTCSKTIAPGLRLGYCVAPREIIARFTLAKQFADLQSGMLAQLAVRGFLDSGAYLRHLETTRAAYNTRRAAMLDGIRAIPALSLQSSASGGFYAWCGLPHGVTGRDIAFRAGRAGVAVLAGEACFSHTAIAPARAEHFIRLSFSSVDEREIGDGLRRLHNVLDAAVSGVIRAPSHAVGPVI